MTASIRSETLSLLALDDYPLTATRYHAEQPHAQLLIAGATGVPQGFYRRFAEHAARRGFNTLTLPQLLDGSFRYSCNP